LVDIAVDELGINFVVINMKDPSDLVTIDALVTALEIAVD